MNFNFRREKKELNNSLKMTYYDGFVFFVYYVFSPLILAFGLIGNSLGIKVLLNKELVNIGPRDIYIYLLITDSFYLLQLIVSFLQYSYDLNLSAISDLSCRLWNYFNYSFATVSCWLIVYISLDRCISIQRPAWRFIMRKKNIQLIFYLLVIVTCLIWYIPVPFYFNGEKSLSSNNQTSKIICKFVDDFGCNLLSYMDLALRVLLQFLLMIDLNIILISSLCEKRRNINDIFLSGVNPTFFRETKLAVSSICLNIIYIVTQLPVSITIFNSKYYSDFYYEFSYFFFIWLMLLISILFWPQIHCFASVFLNCLEIKY